jgi:amidase
MPCSYAPPLPVGFDVQNAAETARVLAAQSPLMAISVLGLPGLAVPTAPHDGIPSGVQVVSGRFREDLCFRVGAIIEASFDRETPHDPRPTGAY